MNNSDYKQIKLRWDVKSRNTIADSMMLIKNESADLYRKLESTLAREPIEKPSEHVGGKESDFFEVQLTEEETQDLIDLLFDLEAATAPQDDGLSFEKEAVKAREANRISGIVDEWNKLNAE